ncbi:hypothetical protein F2P45_21910 [Massilia sp. CCM 8733]|uniref:Lipoprotein n=2 Tax=Massilia mucilaginosa TaxID=2609282 RepID=A0ABX0NXD7_9BURK|nr:hypothetical protein [Massilia mucilaginosa]
MSALRYALALLVLAASNGCAVVAVTGAVVSAGAAVGSAAVGAGVAVTKGAVKVATYPFRDSDEEKAAKARAQAADAD